VGERGRGGRGSTFGRGGPENHIQLTTYSIEYRIQNTPAAKLVYIKLPMYLFFYMDLMILMGTSPLLGPLEGVGHRNGFSPVKIITFRAILTTGTLIVSTLPPAISCPHQ
jgi:hypothetical protein